MKKIQPMFKDELQELYNIQLEYFSKVLFYPSYIPLEIQEKVTTLTDKNLKSQ